VEAKTDNGRQTETSCHHGLFKARIVFLWEWEGELAVVGVDDEHAPQFDLVWYFGDGGGGDYTSVSAAAAVS
jgi:hypothetical protein